jgi:hypothetical protein
MKHRNSKEYIEKYGEIFLLYLLNAFESGDNTGLFKIEPNSPIGEIFTLYAPLDRETGETDYRLGNTTISGIINTLKPNPNCIKEGGKRSRSKRKSKTYKQRKSKTKRSKSKTHKIHIKRK